MESVILGLSPFVLNGIMTFFKWLGANKTLTTPGKRWILAVFAIIGSFAISELTGNPMDADSITNWWNIIVQAFIMFMSSHATYELFWKRG